jgi:hypothetical protein
MSESPQAPQKLLGPPLQIPTRAMFTSPFGRELYDGVVTVSGFRTLKHTVNGIGRAPRGNHAFCDSLNVPQLV